MEPPEDINPSELLAGLWDVVERPPPSLHLYGAQVWVAPFNGLALAGFRQINVFIGPNSSGKTRLLRSIFSACKDRADFLLSRGDNGEKRLASEERVVLLSAPPGETAQGENATACIVHGKGRGPENRVSVGQVEVRDSGIHWPTQGRLTFDEGLEGRTDTKLLEELQQAMNAANDARPASDRRHALSRCVFFLSHRRGVGPAEPRIEGHHHLEPDASNLPGRLGTVFGSKTHRERIENAVSAILSSVEEVTYDHGIESSKAIVRIALEENGHEHFLADTGGGVEQVIAIVVALESESAKGILFIDEPEAHLHEGAQRRLASYICENVGTRQLFIATHSPVFMTAFRDSAIFRMRLSRAGAQVGRAIEPSEQREVLATLGTEAKSILQANATIWVEGSTELEVLRPVLAEAGLREHEDFEFLITGGSMLARFAADEDASRIQMLRVCRNSFGIFDRDGASADEVKAHVARVRGALGDSRSWITEGYEFEWYFPPEAIEDVFGVDTSRLDQYRGKAFYPAMKELGAKSVERPDKAMLARRVVARVLERELRWPSHFNEQVEKLVAFVTEAGGTHDRAHDDSGPSNFDG